MSDEQQLERLEKKVDDGFREMRTDLREMREDIRQLHGQGTTWGVAILGMWLTMLLGFAGIVVAMLAQV